MTRQMYEKITCQRAVLTPTGAGEQQESWQDIATVWADIRVTSSDLSVRARAEYLAPNYLLRIRYQVNLLATRIILWQGKSYRVVSLKNPDNRKRILEMRVVEAFGQ